MPDIDLDCRSPKAEMAARRARTLLTAYIGSDRSARNTLFTELLGEAVDELAGDREALAYLLMALAYLGSIGFYAMVYSHNDELPEDLHVTIEEFLARTFSEVLERGGTI